jgi:hypothetical protein
MMSALPKTSYREPLPGRDHYSSWYCRRTGRYLFVDEPYQPTDKLIAARADWAKEFDFEIAAPDWLGTHNPYAGTGLFVLSHKKRGIPLPQVLQALAQLERPIDDRNWQGSSGPVVPPFYSPGWELEHKLKSTKQPKKTRPLGPRKTVEFFMFGVGKCRRPDARMPITSHTEVGTGLKQLLVRYAKRPGVYNRLDHVRSELDEWVQREYTRSELGDEQFFDLYYHETALVDSAAERDFQSDIASILRIKNTIESHYPPCPPVRRLIGKLDLVVGSMQKMLTSSAG